MAGARDAQGRILPGHSLNPGGRPKGSKELRDLARAHSAEALETLVHVMRNGHSDRDRLAAATALLDRAYGKVQAAADFEEADSQEAFEANRQQMARFSTEELIAFLDAQPGSPMQPPVDPPRR